MKPPPLCPQWAQGLPPRNAEASAPQGPGVRWHRGPPFSHLRLSFPSNAGLPEMAMRWGELMIYVSLPQLLILAVK